MTLAAAEACDRVVARVDGVSQHQQRLRRKNEHSPWLITRISFRCCRFARR